VTLKHPSAGTARATELSLGPRFGLIGDAVPRHELPPGEMPPEVAYQVIHDELMLDGNARLNVATFVSTWMEPEAERLIAECLDKNMIDKDEYPQTAEIESRCVGILSHLWHAPDAAQATGCSTTGSSEAAMLGGLALKRRWQKRRAAEGKPADTPNLVMGINVQVCWEKFANYWDVEMRLVPMEGDRYHLSAEEAVKLCDENTIGVVAILGSTFDGSYEPVKEICDALDKLQEETGLDIPVRFVFVTDSAQSDVRVSWIDHFDTAISGKTLWARDRSWWIVNGNITLALHHNGGEPLDDSAVKAISLHEVGHLLGLDHTLDTSNIMTARVRVRDLSSADRATMELLYTLPPGSVK